MKLFLKLAALSLAYILLQSVTLLGQQEKSPRFYIVNDADGYVNVREEPRKDAKAIARLANLHVAINIRDDYGAYEKNDWIYTTKGGYIHKSRLQPVADSSALRYLHREYNRQDSSRYYEVWDSFMLMDRDIPYVFIVGAENWSIEPSCFEFFAIADTKIDKLIYRGGIPCCHYPKLQQNSISFTVSDVLPLSANPEEPWEHYDIATLKLKPHADSYKLCSDILVNYQELTAAEAKKIVDDFEQKLKPSESNTNMQSTNSSYFINVYMLLYAYMSGEQRGKGLLEKYNEKVSIDASMWHEWSGALQLLSLYELSLSCQ